MKVFLSFFMLSLMVLAIPGKSYAQGEAAVPFLLLAPDSRFSAIGESGGGLADNASSASLLDRVEEVTKEGPEVIMPDPEIVEEGGVPEDIEADHHIMVFSRKFDVDWFYDAAWRYWETYRPIIIGDMKILSYIPSEKTIVATLVVTEGEEKQIAAEVRRIRPDIMVDLVIADFQEELRAEFEWRAIKGRRFG